ncbi:hypothetical protein HNR40_007832 [Nonomuraea endophytica]|uniref:Uncharacterized protein n=1 Tax=Nonomuraea endophytica TaxID=714136 RepID=A0A7W8A9W5_9ACTN|nr:hypothetical protein [Nonomuraea endophytica]
MADIGRTSKNLNHHTLIRSQRQFRSTVTRPFQANPEPPEVMIISCPQGRRLVSVLKPVPVAFQRDDLGMISQAPGGHGATRRAAAGSGPGRPAPAGWFPDRRKRRPGQASGFFTRWDSTSKPAGRGRLGRGGGPGVRGQRSPHGHRWRSRLGLSVSLAPPAATCDIPAARCAVDELDLGQRRYHSPLSRANACRAAVVISWSGPSTASMRSATCAYSALACASAPAASYVEDRPNQVINLSGWSAPTTRSWAVSVCSNCSIA